MYVCMYDIFCTLQLSTVTEHEQGEKEKLDDIQVSSSLCHLALLVEVSLNNAVQCLILLKYSLHRRCTQVPR